MRIHLYLLYLVTIHMYLHWYDNDIYIYMFLLKLHTCTRFFSCIVSRWSVTVITNCITILCTCIAVQCMIFTAAVGLTRDTCVSLISCTSTVVLYFFIGEITAITDWIFNDVVSVLDTNETRNWTRDTILNGDTLVMILITTQPEW